MESIVISVIVPIYNSEHTICKCLDSVLSQSFKYIELILVDDGSTDASGRICDEYKSDERVSVLHQMNSGVSAARNAGLKLAQGEYIFFLDSDDYIEPEMFTMILNYIEKYSRPSIIFYGFKVEYNGAIFNEVMPDLKFSHASIDFLNMIFLLERKELLGWTWNKFFKRDIVFRHNVFFNNNLSFQEDYIFTLNYLKYINDILTLEISPYHYNISSPGSLINRLPSYCDFKLKENLLLENKLGILRCQKKYISEQSYRYYVNKAFKWYHLSHMHQLSNIIVYKTDIEEKKRYVSFLRKDIKKIPLKYFTFKLSIIYILSYSSDNIFFHMIKILKRLVSK